MALPSFSRAIVTVGNVTPGVPDVLWQHRQGSVLKEHVCQSAITRFHLAGDDYQLD
jgi:hypothetical protein